MSWLRCGHPFKRYYQQGVVVTLNTDGPLTDGITLTDEYFWRTPCSSLA